MAVAPLSGPLGNRLLNALLMASVDAVFYGTLAGILTLWIYALGLIPGAVCGAVWGLFASRRTPLRETVVLFVGSILTGGLILWRGHAVGGDSLWLFPGVGLGGPAGGVLLRTAIQSLGPARCRWGALILAAGLVLMSFSLFAWWAYHPGD